MPPPLQAVNSFTAVKPVRKWFAHGTGQPKLGHMSSAQAWNASTRQAQVIVKSSMARMTPPLEENAPDASADLRRVAVAQQLWRAHNSVTILPRLATGRSYSADAKSASHFLGDPDRTSSG
jgi:hypothetical protein